MKTSEDFELIITTLNILNKEIKWINDNIIICTVYKKFLFSFVLNSHIIIDLFTVRSLSLPV